jgi:hypothetical protein
VNGVIAEEISPLLSRMQDCENAAAMLRSELRALQSGMHQMRGGAETEIVAFHTLWQA